MKIFNTPIAKRLLIVTCIFSLLVWSCSGDDDTDDPDVGDVGAEDVAVDVPPEEDAEFDTGEDADADAGPSEEPGEWVDLDLEPFLEGAPDPDGSVQVFEVTDPDDLIDGESATGRVGDYILENEQVRFVVDQDERNVGACPWGGNIVDAESRLDSFGGDILGDICLFLNADQTFKPEEYDIIHDGAEGAGVLAVTGRTEILDYLNVKAMIGAMGDGFADLFELRPDGLLPLRLTKYYILRPGDQGVRVLTMLRNDGDEDLSIVASHLLVSGADGTYFNPLSSLGGFGYVDRGLADPDPDLLPYLALLTDDSGVAYMPRPSDEIDADLPVSGAYLTIFNVAASVIGVENIVNTLLANEQQLKTAQGVLQLEPGDVEMVEYWTYVTDGSLSTMADVIYDELGAETGEIEGVVRDAGDDLVAGARVTAVDSEGRTMNQTLTDDNGEYSMRVPGDSYEVTARNSDQYTVTPAMVSVENGGTASVDEIVTEPAGVVEVTVETPDGEPTPARVTFICQGSCDGKPTSNEEDVTIDGLPENWADVDWVGVDGELDVMLPAGDYEVVVSRGMEWSLWPADFADNGGQLITVEAGEATSIDAEIARVIDTTGALSGDFHVHSLSSLDSTTPHRDRVLTFLSEGVDVIVSSDHDEIADYGPAVEALGAEDEIVSLVGNEITTIDLGHINGFPLVRDEDDRQGGALDWGAGAELALPPGEIYDWIREFPGEQVVQLNHPDSSYFRFSDVVRGIAYGDPSQMRVQTPDYDPDTGDTGLWSDEFTAMELMNGPDLERFWGVTRWWLTMIGRGATPTGTGVTDTHVRYGRVLGGVPRTFVYVDEANDSAASFDTEHFVDAVNTQSAIGTNGPFVRVEATNDDGESAGLGEVLATNDETVTFEVTVEVPEWVEVNRIEMIMNSDDVVTEPGGYETDPIPPTDTFDIEFDGEDLEVVATGEEEHRRYRKVVEIDVDTDEDAYVVFLVRGNDGMYPVLPDNNIEPFAFTNPVYLDADGEGYSDPHLAELAASEPESNPAMLMGLENEMELHEMTREELLEHFVDSDHQHHNHHHHHH